MPITFALIIEKNIEYIMTHTFTSISAKRKKKILQLLITSKQKKVSNALFLICEAQSDMLRVLKALVVYILEISYEYS